METNISQLQVKQQEKYPEILSDDALLFIEKLSKIQSKKIRITRKAKRTTKTF